MQNAKKKDGSHPALRDAWDAETDEKGERRTSYEHLNSLMREMTVRYPPVYHQAFQEMYQQYRQGSTPEQRREARDRIVYGNVRLAAHWALRYHGRGLNMADLLSIALAGLERALESYDPGLETTFATYATWWIKQYVRRAVHDRGRTIRLPVHAEEFLGRVRMTRAALLAEHGQQPTDEATVARMRSKYVQDAKLTIASFKKKMQQTAPAAMPVVSLSQPIHNDNVDITLEDVVSAPEPIPHEDVIDNSRLLGYIKAELDCWDASKQSKVRRNAIVLRLRLGIDGVGPETLEEIGIRMGLSRERIRQLQKQAVEQLLKALSKKGLLTEYRIEEVCDLL